MKLLDVKTVLDREKNIQKPESNSEYEVMKYRDDETTKYAILSHRWGIEVDYEEMTGLMKMEGRKRDEVRQRDGYQKIIKSCEQAMKDGYEWLWIDTCCIDKRSSSELSEAINSMYRWYRNAHVCHAYLHDVDESTFPTRPANKFSKSNGWPEWFMRGWTLQELVAPKQLEFFNKNWVRIGNKRRLAPMLEDITRIPIEVLRDGLGGAKNLGVAQIMSWAADRKTTRVEDRAYSLLGLFDVSMPMLYGEGKKAFHRLQLEIIRTSSDQSIFAWDPRTPRPGSVLADDPSDFRDCRHIEPLGPGEFADRLVEYIEDNELGKQHTSRKFSINPIHRHRLAQLRLRARTLSQQLRTFSVSNAGIQVWLPVVPYDDSPSHCRAILACSRIKGYHPHGLITIDLASSGSSFDRIFDSTGVHKTYPEFRTLHLTHHQDVNHIHHHFTLDDKNAMYYGFTHCGTFPRESVGNMVTLSSLTDDLVIVVYANDDARYRFAVALGYYLGQGWVHIVCDERLEKQEVNGTPWLDFAKLTYDRMWKARAELAQSMPNPIEVYATYDTNTVIKHAHLPRSIWAARVLWGRWGTDKFQVTVDVDQCAGCCHGPHGWTTTSDDWDGLDVPGLMSVVSHSHRLKLDGWWVWLDKHAGQKIVLGDYGDYSDGNFKCDGNIFEDMRALGIDSMDPVYHPVVSRVSGDQFYWHEFRDQNDHDLPYDDDRKELELNRLKGYSLPANQHFVLLLKAYCTRLAGKYLVITIIQHSDVPLRIGCRAKRRDSGGELAPNNVNHFADLTPFYTVASPQAWRRDPACTRRRELFKTIREHFYTLCQPARTEARNKSANKQKTTGAIKFFSEIFGLKCLRNYVGEITFFKGLHSMMATKPCNEVSVGTAEGPSVTSVPPSKLPFVSWGMTHNLFKRKFPFQVTRDPRLEVLLPLLRKRCQGLDPFDDISHQRDEEQKTEHEVKSLSQTLSAGLLEHISTTFNNAALPDEHHLIGRVDYDRQFNAHPMVQEIKELQVKLDATDDEDEQRALEEDVTGKILWLCWCGICAEVDQLLPEVVDYCRREGCMIGLSEVGCIIAGTRTEPNDDRAHLQRIMLDAGAGTSKYQLLLTARAAEQVKWSSTAILRNTPLGTQETILGTSSQIHSTLAV